MPARAARRPARDPSTGPARRPARLLRVLPLAVMAGLLVTMLLAGPALAGGFCHDQPMSDAAGVTVSMRNNCFTPTVLRVKPGQTVTFVNRDAGVEHPVAGANGMWGLGEGASSNAVRFDETGVYPYFCHTHLGMIGVIVVGDGTASEARPMPVAAEPALTAAAQAQAADQAAGDAEAPGPAWASGTALAIAAGVGALGALAGGAVVRRRRGESQKRG